MAKGKIFDGIGEILAEGFDSLLENPAMNLELMLGRAKVSPSAPLVHVALEKLSSSNADLVASPKNYVPAQDWQQAYQLLDRMGEEAVLQAKPKQTLSYPTLSREGRDAIQTLIKQQSAISDMNDLIRETETRYGKTGRSDALGAKKIKDGMAQLFTQHELIQAQIVGEAFTQLAKDYRQFIEDHGAVLVNEELAGKLREAAEGNPYAKGYPETYPAEPIKAVLEDAVKISNLVATECQRLAEQCQHSMAQAVSKDSARG